MICTQEDGFILEIFDANTRWIATLSDGTRVYQDDERPGLETSSAWIRLREYLAERPELKIDNMVIQFRSNMIHVNDGPVDGFFFCKAALGSPVMPKTVGFFVVGTIKNGILKTRKYRVPELLLDCEEERDIEQYRDFIIFNNGQN